MKYWQDLKIIRTSDATYIALHVEENMVMTLQFVHNQFGDVVECDYGTHYANKDIAPEDAAHTPVCQVLRSFGYNCGCYYDGGGRSEMSVVMDIFGLTKTVVWHWEEWK